MDITSIIQNNMGTLVSSFVAFIATYSLLRYRVDQIEKVLVDHDEKLDQLKEKEAQNLNMITNRLASIDSKLQLIIDKKLK